MHSSGAKPQRGLSCSRDGPWRIMNFLSNFDIDTLGASRAYYKIHLGIVVFDHSQTRSFLFTKLGVPFIVGMVLL